MPFSRQYIKSVILYALIGFFVVGGVGVSKAHASSLIMSPDSIGINGVHSTSTSIIATTNVGEICSYPYILPFGRINITGGSSGQWQLQLPRYRNDWPTPTGNMNGGEWVLMYSDAGDVLTDDCDPNDYDIIYRLSVPSTNDSWQFSTTSAQEIINQTSTTTHFISESISTTTRTIDVTGYIASGDVSRPVRYSLVVSTPIYSAWNQDSFIATTSGAFSHSFQYTGSFSSTTIEQFTFSGQLYYFAGNPFTDASSTVVLDTFSTTTSPGIAQDFTAADIENGIAENCKPFSSFWSVGLCIQYLIYPSTAQVTQNLNDIKQTFLTKMPMGYITRLVQIISASTTTQLPVLSYTWQSDSPLSGDTLSFDTGTYFVQAAALNSEMTSNTDHKTAWQIFAPLINIFLAIVLIFGMIHDISGLPLIHHKK